MSAADRDALAALLSWASGEFTRYQPDAHPDHNRWSWEGDGHGEALRNLFREEADAILASDWLTARKREWQAEAWHEGWHEGVDALSRVIQTGDLAPNPYRVTEATS